VTAPSALEKMSAALVAVDWNAIVQAFFVEKELASAFAECNLRLAIWSRQLEEADEGNPALPFIREMQAQGQNASALASLSLYKAAAASVRGLVETALYYVYFRVHPAELATLLRDPSYYPDKKFLLSYLKTHIPNFTARQEVLGLISELEPWYSDISAVVHGQVPGTWAVKNPFKNQGMDKDAAGELRSYFQQAVRIADGLFKVCLADELWGKFSTSSKQHLIKGMAGPHKQALGLDAG
jgi:hypothetical protein